MKMMRLKYYIIWCIALPCLMACEKEELQTTDPEAARVSLSASIDNKADTRAAYTLTTPGTGSSSLSTRVWASTTDNSYSNTGAIGTDGYTVATHFNVNFTASAVQVSDALIIYPSNGTPPTINTPIVYFVGFYPPTGWSEGNATSSSFSSFDGKTDLMYAPKDEGHYGDLASPPLLHFYHLLTYLDIKLYAESEEARDAWGDIMSMTISSRNNIQVDLSSVPSITDNTILSTVSTTGDATNMSIYNTDDTVFPSSSYSMPTSLGTAKNVYVMCAPVSATGSGSNDYTLSITTEKRGAVDVGIDLKDGASTYYSGSTMGKKFTVTLTFGFGNTIAVASEMVNDWTNGGYGKATFDE